MTTLMWIACGVLGLVALFFLAILPHNLRIRRVRRAYESVPPQVRRRVKELIAQHAAQGQAVTLLCRCPDEGYTEARARVASHLGGLPYAEAGQRWPLDDEQQPARFLIQVRLEEPSLPAVWQGRLVQVFFQESDEQILRAFAAPRAERYVPLEPLGPLCPGEMLEPLRYPAAPGEEGEPDECLPLSCHALVAQLPALAQTLQPYTKETAGVVSQVLAPQNYGYEIEGDNTAYVGGTPYLIQGPHDPTCPECGQAMRFLFCFGDIVPDFQMADSGCCCVYGCDQHPEQLRAFVDSH